MVVNICVAKLVPTCLMYLFCKVSYRLDRVSYCLSNANLLEYCTVYWIWSTVLAWTLVLRLAVSSVLESVGLMGTLSSFCSFLNVFQVFSLLKRYLVATW